MASFLARQLLEPNRALWGAGNWTGLCLLFVKMRLGPFPFAPEERWQRISWLGYLKDFCSHQDFPLLLLRGTKLDHLRLWEALLFVFSFTLKQIHFFLKNEFSTLRMFQYLLQSLRMHYEFTFKPCFLFKPQSVPCNFPVQRGICSY